MTHIKTANGKEDNSTEKQPSPGADARHHTSTHKQAYHTSTHKQAYHTSTHKQAYHTSTHKQAYHTSTHKHSGCHRQVEAGISVATHVQVRSSSKQFKPYIMLLRKIQVKMTVKHINNILQI